MIDQLLSLFALPLPAGLFAGLLTAVLLLSRRVRELTGRLDRLARLLDEIDSSTGRLAARLNRLEGGRPGHSSGAKLIPFNR